MRQLRGNELERVVGRIYEAALDPRLWRPVLNEIAQAVGAGSAALFSSPALPSIGLYHSPGFDEFATWLAGEGQSVHNPRPERAMRMSQHQRVITESHLFSDWETANIPFNVEMTRRGLHREAGVVSFVDGVPFIFSCQRPFGDDRFGSAELESIEALLPHIERAAHIATRFASERMDGMLQTFERMACGGILLGADGRVVRLNPMAEVLVGGCLDVASGRLSASDKLADGELQRLVASVTYAKPALKRSGPAPFAPLPRPGRRPLAVYAMPLVGDSPDLFQRARAILVIVDPDANRDVRSELLARLYGLTPAELRLAMALAKGKEVKEIAETHGLSQHTVRTQLKSLMAKTETRRQSELVALLIRSSIAPTNLG